MLIRTVKLRFKAVRKLLELGDEFEVRTEQQYEFALRCWREKIVEVRRAGDEELSRVFSQCKQVLKQRYARLSSRCPNCGEGKSRYADYCRMCYNTLRYYGHSLRDQSPPKGRGRCIQDEFTHLLVSRQRKYQLRMQRDSCCTECGELAVRGSQCLKHLVKAREWQRKKRGLKRRYWSFSYRLQAAASVSSQGRGKKKTT
jgi:hypothetical protein